MEVVMRVVHLLGSLIFLLTPSLHATGLQDLLGVVTRAMATATSDHLHFVIFAFLGGFLTSLLPCIYPMIPITVGIIQGQGARSVFRSFQLAFAYVNGLALVYATLGYVSAKFSLMFGSWLSSPLFIVFTVLLLGYFAGSLIGFYELYIPRFLQMTSSVTGGSIVQCFFMGMGSAFVASPCLAPPLVVLIGLAAKQANPFLGFLGLYSFSLGMSLILLAAGTFSGLITVLPRGGAWLDLLKQFFGYVMLFIAASFLRPLIGIKFLIGIYASLALALVWHFCYQIYVAQSKKGAISQARLSIAVAIVITALCGLFFRSIFLFLARLLP